MNLTRLASELEELPDLVDRRWFGSDARPRVSFVAELDPPWPALVRAVVTSGDDRYQLVLGLHTGSAGTALGMVEVDEGKAACVDATTDPASAIALLRHVAPSEEVSTARPIMAEQSNSSVVYDERLILKVFRRLSGHNPEVEVTDGLARVGFAHIAAPIGVWEADGDDLALLQEFLTGGVEGWALALTSVRDHLDHGGDPASAGGDLGPEASRLGDMTASLHLALATAFGTTPGDAKAWAAAMAVRTADVDHPSVDRRAVRSVTDAVASLEDAGAAIRVHGDYHLGQVMRSDTGWYVLDFEGEPTRPVEERRAVTSPLRDVAGMLRSLSYAAAVGAGEFGAPLGAAEAWERHNRDAFLDAYLEGMHGSPLLPSSPSTTRQLLHAFELDKAVYEVGYEQAHRPDWIDIPLAGVSALLRS